MNQPSLASLQKKVDVFNQTYGIGCRVDLRLDSGETKSVTVRAPASILGGHSAVAWFEEISGCYSIDRVNVKSL